MKFPIIVLLILNLLPSGLLFGQENNTIVHENSEFPLRATFYYAWYPNNWDPNGYHVTYNPTFGYYDSNDRTIINKHIDEHEYANVDVVIASWWGLDNDNRKPRDWAIKKCMEETDRRTANGEIDLKWAIYYELEASYNESMDTVKADLEYLMERYVNKHDCYAHIDGKPVIFAYTRGSEDNTEEFMKKWADAVDNKWYYVLKTFGGYRDRQNQPSSWHQYGPSTRIHRVDDSEKKMVSYNISPGFKHADPNKTTFLERASEELWTDLVKEMVDSEVDWQLVTSYNEWGEGTAIESAAEWQTDSGYGMYLDVLHNYAIKDDPVLSVNKGSGQIEKIENLPYSLTGNTLQISQQPNKITVYSLSGQVVLQEQNISTKALKFKDRFVILHLEIDGKMCRIKYLNF